ncbi:MAG: C39 family peptidase [Deltaproteobacteria bacterium]|nr:C39 family peptidase [Deltaproteobacteria bacterium]
MPKDELILNVGAPGIEDVRVRPKVRPLTEFRDENIVKQEHDYSCGSAALATLMKYYLGEDLTETQVINGLFHYGDRNQIEKRRAFSLLDMKRFVSVLGYNVAGYTAEIDDLRSLGMPCIIPINVFQYKHFVVFKGIYQDHVFLADPYLGNTSYTLDMFEDIWYRNVVFMVTNAGNELDLLLLKDDDLRIVDFDMTERALEEVNPRSLITDERKLLESTNNYFFRKAH